MSSAAMAATSRSLISTRPARPNRARSQDPVSHGDQVMSDTNDPHNLIRFVQAQAGDYEQALSEIRSGRKLTHWMWYIFPQVDGLGFSSMSKRYSIKDLAEA